MDVNILKDLTQEMSILYVEDDLNSSTMINSILKELFKDVSFAKDGEEGLKKYKNGKFDIVLSDIKMPNLNGIDMSKEIKEIDKNQNIIILTAYEESKYYSSAIDIGVDSFILKPIKTEQLIETLYKSAKKIKDAKDAEFYRNYLEKRVAEEVAKNREKDKVAIEMLNTLLNAYPNPTIVYLKRKVEFVNEAFKNMLNSQVDEDFELSNIFLKEKKFKTSVVKFVEDSSKNLVLIKTKRGKKIFMAIAKEITLNKNLHNLYTLIDVTSLEQQRLKVKQLNIMLKNYILYQMHKTFKSTEKLKEIKEEQKEKYVIDNQQKRILRKSHKIKIDAKTFITQIENENIEDLDEINDRKNNLLEVHDEFNFNTSIKNIYKMGDSFEHFAMAINRFLDFADIAYGVISLASFLKKLTEEDIKEKDLTLFKNYIKSIINDFEKWEKSIFIDKDAIDIHYMDSSLFNTCLQVELDFFKKEIEDDDDDFMMF